MENDHKAALAGLRADLDQARPLVVCLTSAVAAPFTAQALSALGAVPVMPGHGDDLAGAVARSDALLINLGSSDDARADLFRTAVAAAREAGRPWVLDPVGAGGGAWRTTLARALSREAPRIIKGNPAEIRALAGQVAKLKGVDSLDEVNSALGAAQSLLDAEDGPQAVVITGPRDACVGPSGVVWTHGGHRLAPRVVTMGCTLGAVCAAAASQYPAPRAGQVAAQSFKQAAERAGERAQGLGSFMAAFLDALDGAWDGAWIEEAKGS